MCPMSLFFGSVPYPQGSFNLWGIVLYIVGCPFMGSRNLPDFYRDAGRVGFHIVFMCLVVIVQRVPKIVIGSPTEWASDKPMVWSFHCVIPELLKSRRQDYSLPHLNYSK